MNLQSIHSPADLRGMSMAELRNLAADLRTALIARLASRGGHVGPNLGVVEATVALHYVFDTPADKIVFDVSHQTYIHKMLTGRMAAFTDPAHYGEVTGYTSPEESPAYDLFEIGHTSTSISLATGLAKARDLAGGRENVVAFIGDASLGGGMALEGLNFAPTLKSNFIVVLNDNQRSIAENHGALYDHLAALRRSGGKDKDNIFTALGYEYIYVADGNDLEALVEAFRRAKDRPCAVLVHINTRKGDGLAAAEGDPERFHWTTPFDAATGAPLSEDDSEDYADIFSRHMLARMEADPRIAVLTAGTPGSFGFGPEERRRAGSQFIDVGIAEQDAVAMTAGLAKGGARPVLAAVSTFIQRAYDQVEHDIAINGLPAVLAIFYGSAYGLTDVTHLGWFDIALFSNIPSLKYLAAASVEEYLAMLDQAIDRPDGAVALRAPARVWHSPVAVDPDFSRYQIVRPGSKVAIIAAGYCLPTALEAADILGARGIGAQVVNPRILSKVDAGYLDSVREFDRVITVEDGIADGGFGQKVAAYLGDAPVKVNVLGLRKEFADRYTPAELLRANGMTAPQIAALVQ